VTNSYHQNFEIRTYNKKEDEIIKRDWPERAFGCLKIIKKVERHIAAMRLVPKKISVASEIFNVFMQENGIFKAIRWKNRDI
jgi:hypothetical protein